MIDRQYPHGTRSSYLAGCKCLKCRQSNAARRRRCYHQRGRVLDFAALTTHLQSLAAKGLGRDRIAELASVSDYTVKRAQTGYHVNVATYDALMRVQPSIAPGARVEALPAWRVVRWLLSEGFTRAQVAQMVGVRRIRLRKRYTARVVARLHLLRKKFEAEGWTWPEDDDGEGSFGRDVPPS